MPCSSSASSSLSSWPISRPTARVNSPPLIPILRWMRQPSTAIPLSCSAFCHEKTWA